MNRRALLLSTLVAALAVSPFAFADWPTLRHDAQRTATATGTSTITTPTPYWQVYMGGSLRSSSYFALDVAGDGRTEILYLAGGKAIAKLPDDRLVWETPPVELSQLFGAVDLDGDGKTEIVAGSSRNVFVLEGATGRILWREPDGEVGAIGGVRIEDLDGDKHPEVLIDDCACCGISATASPAGGVYHFALGKLDAPTKVYTPLSRSHCGSSSVTIGDFDGDGVGDVAYAEPTDVVLTTGKTGAPLGTSATVAEVAYYTSCTAAQLDGRPGDELLCYQNTYLASAGGGQRVFALAYDASATPKVKTLWNVAPVAKDTGKLFFLDDSLRDLDGDGKLEVTVSWHDGTSWSTSVYDAETGTSLGTLPAVKVQGLLDLDGDKKPEVVTLPGGVAGSGFRAHKFARTATPALTPFSTLLESYAVPRQWSFDQARRSALTTTSLTIDRLGDGNSWPVLVAAKAYGVYQFDASGAPKALASYPIPTGLSLLTAQVYPNVNRPYPQLTVTRNDGYLVVLDSDFAATNGVTVGSGEFKEFLPGKRVGGFVALPIAPRLGGMDVPVATDSRGALVRLDASAAWMQAPPKIAWELPGVINPTSAATIDAGKPGFVCARRGATGYNKLTATSADGKVLWEQTMPSEGVVDHDTLAADVNGDGVSDVFTAYLTPGSVLNHQVFNGKTGSPMWTTPLSEALSWGYQPFSLADWDGNGVLDLYTVLNNLRVHDGASGAKLKNNPEFLGYFTPAIADVDGDGKLDVTMSRGYFPARTYKEDLSTATWTGSDDRPYQHGARAACSGARSVWVQPSSQYQGLVRLITMNGTDVGKTATIYLAGGSVYATTADATSAGKFVGSLGDVAIKTDLLGKGAHPSALVGSSDGYLYALNPCDGTVDWAYDMRFDVGDPILADTNGDGVDEIVVPSADGYLYALSQRLLDAPAFVNDNEPTATAGGPDIDTVSTKDRLAASWGAVAGADGYQVAAITEGGSYVTQPDWVNVGPVTFTVLKNLGLVAGKKYVIAVRAVSKTKGSSLDTRSNGVTVTALVDPDGGLGDATLGDDSGVYDDSGLALDGGDAASPLGPADAPASSGCGCRTSSSGASAGGAALLAMALGVAWSRRRARLQVRSRARS